MQYWRPIVALLMVIAGEAISLPALFASAGTERTVRGEVVAVNVSHPPQTIVVKLTVSGNREMIVGADVGNDTPILRGGTRVPLNAIKPGDRVTLVYVKHDKGLTASS